VVALAAPALAQTSATLETLRQRSLANAVGIVEGRAYLERSKPSAPDEPLAGVSLLFLPRADELLAALEETKREARESMRGFRDAAPTVRHALEEHEMRLWRAGYPEAAVRVGADADGKFRVDLPAGAWLLVAQRSVFVPVQTARDAPAPPATAIDALARYSTNAYQHFLPTTRLTGFDAVSIWLRELTLAQGETLSVELHDRGVWLSGVIEEADHPRRVRLGDTGRRR
jgi:hypothetical protein